MRSIHKKVRQSDEMTLQITSMADVFTIILVFLLKSYATSAVNITPTQGMKIPVGESLEAPTEALKIEISEFSVQVESKPVAELKQFRFDLSDLQTNMTSRTVNQALETEKKRQQLIAQYNPNVKLDSKVLIIADQRTPYVTLKSVLATAAVNGFTDFKLVAVNKN